MWASTLWALAFLLSGCHPALPEAPRPVEGMIAHTMLMKDPGCTGVRVGGGLVVTAAHCLNDRVLGDLYTDLKVGYISPHHDFAVLSGDTPVSPVWLVDARIGERLYVVGYPGSIDDDTQPLTVTDGVYTGVTSGNMERITAFAYYGNSGGGVWSETGALLGIVVEIRPAGDGNYGPVPMPAHSYMVPIRYVRSVLLD